jgi:nucleoside phosphorylase
MIMKSMSVEEVLAEARQRKLRLVLVVTALDLELQAVLAHLQPLASVKGRDSTIYECGTFHDDGQDWLVIVAETGAGKHSAQSAVTNAHIHFAPEIQIFVGVGGSRKEDVPIGSVVVADHVYMPYGGKYGEKGFSARPREFPTDPRVLGVARKVRRDKSWVARIKNPADGKLPALDAYPVGYPPLGHVAPAVSTEAVLANEDSDLANLIAHEYGDACIVEMEGYGAVYAASQESKPAIMIRGVSDMTENKKPASDKILQPIAACHAAALPSNCSCNGVISIRRPAFPLSCQSRLPHRRRVRKGRWPRLRWVWRAHSSSISSPNPTRYHPNDWRRSRVR